LPIPSAKTGLILDRINALVQAKLPILIHFENYGILDSAII
jgi:hypothetical protein